jgi:hypothetical protein
VLWANCPVLLIYFGPNSVEFSLLGFDQSGFDHEFSCSDGVCYCIHPRRSVPDYCETVYSEERSATERFKNIHAFENFLRKLFTFVSFTKNFFDMAYDRIAKPLGEFENNVTNESIAQNYFGFTFR